MKIKTKVVAVKYVAEMSWQRTKKAEASKPRAGWAEFFQYCMSMNGAN